MTTPQHNDRKEYLDFVKSSRDFGSLDMAFASTSSTTDVRMRPQYTRTTYEKGRPAERIPEGRTQMEQHEIMSLCSSVYDRVGIVKTFIDILSEFAAAGINITHTDPALSKFWKSWFEKIRGADRSEMFVRYLCKSGNAVVRRQFAKMKSDDVINLRRSADVDSLLPDASLSVKAGRVPIKYTFYDPATVDLVGEAFAVFANNKQYALRVPLTNYMSLTRPKNDLERKVWESLPQDIKDGILGNKTQGYYYIPLPEELVYVAHYKKDDTEMWAKPMIYATLADIFYNDKLKLAKTAALDGMINCVKLWTLGDHTKDITPNPILFPKLSNILSNSVGGGGQTIIWDSAINYKEYYPPIENLVNFEENVDAVLLGLGVPKSLIGGMEEGSSKINMLSFKGLLRKIEALRRALTEFWQTEIAYVQEAMGFRKEPFIEFAQTDLYDDAVWFDLLIKMVDRDLISDQRTLELIGENPVLEALRIKQENELRASGSKPPKAGTLHNPMLKDQQAHELKQAKIQAQSRNMSEAKPTGNISKGRPQGKKDSTPRSRTSKAALAAVAEGLYDKVDTFVTAAMLAEFGHKDARKLSAKQKTEIDDSIAWLFINVPPDANGSEDSLLEAYTSASGPLSEYTKIYEAGIAALKPEDVTQSKKKLLRSIAYAEAWADKYENLSN